MLKQRAPLKSRGFAKPERRPAKEYEGARPGSPRPIARAGSAVSLLDDIAKPAERPERDATTAEGRRHMGRVAGLGCLICRRLGYGPSSAEVHHVREGQGGAQRAPDFLTVPLCPEHHRGSTGFHGLGTRAFERRYGIDELGMLAETIRQLSST